MVLSSRRFLPLPAAGLALTVALLSGCEKEAITSYTVPRPTVRQLGVMVPRADFVWFIKLAGPVEAVTENEKDFDEFIASVRFPSEAAEKDTGKDPITWTVPEAWKKEQSREEIRYATFRGRLGLEIIVTPLSTEKADAAAVLPNVNRWRRQLNLPEVKEDQIKDITKTITVGGVTTATRIDCTGVGGQVTKAPPPRVRPDRPQNRHAAAGGLSPLDYKAPPDWNRATTVMEQIASFQVGEGNENVGITITPMPGGAGGLVANVNRWRDQVGLTEMSTTEIEADGKQITIDGRSALFVDFKGKDKASGKDKRIVGAICETGGRTWFFKMTGMIDAVEKQKTAFDQFLRSVRFGGEHTRPDRLQNPQAATGGPPARQVDYKAPPEWQTATTQMEQIASFSVGEGGETVGITVTPMGGGAGGLLANVNRWRGQVGLTEMSATEIEADGKQITIDGRSALFVDFKGKDKASGKDKRIVGAICEKAGRTWFFKMTGPIDAVEKQKPAFDQFLRSVRFGGE